uniref:Uncharacterized protein n=1 Tax=Caenorhabditis japonica TaxID=281687 RepID=A0A8R1E474_CAEJA
RSPAGHNTDRNDVQFEEDGEISSQRQAAGQHNNLSWGYMCCSKPIVEEINAPPKQSSVCHRCNGNNWERDVGSGEPQAFCTTDRYPI